MEAGTNALDAIVPGAGGVARGVRTLLGLGRYSVKGNSLMASPVPAMHSTIDRGVRIAHHEFLGDISSSTAFAITRHNVNPGMATVFPWLSSVAAAFQKYELHGLVFFLKSTSASALNSTNTALGTVIGAMQYNPYAPSPANKTEMLALSGSADGKPAEDQIYPLECDKTMTVFGTKLVRSGGVTDDLAKYDAAVFNLATVGSQAAAVIGELYVAYDVTLKEPRVGDAGWSSHVNLLTGADSSHPLGTDPSITYNGLGLSFDVANQKILLPVGTVGKFVVQLLYIGTAATLTAPSVSYTNCASFNLYTGLTGAAVPANGASSATFTYTFGVNVTNASAQAVITIGSGGTLPSTMTVAQLVVDQLEDSYT